jgi:hypothetical protein
VRAISIRLSLTTLVLCCPSDPNSHIHHPPFDVEPNPDSPAQAEAYQIFR